DRYHLRVQAVVFQGDEGVQRQYHLGLEVHLQAGHEEQLGDAVLLQRERLGSGDAGNAGDWRERPQYDRASAHDVLPEDVGEHRQFRRCRDLDTAGVLELVAKLHRVRPAETGDVHALAP